MNNSIIYGIVWAGIVMLFQFSMWKGNMLEDYHDWLEEFPDLISKPLGLCIVCFGLWFGVIFSWLNRVEYYIVFMGISEGILVLYTILLSTFEEKN